MLIWDQNWSQCTACSHFQCWLRHSWRSTPHYPVKRLFSVSAQVLTARRCRMSDETLNQHIFLRSQFNVTYPDKLTKTKPRGF